jgi:heat shock protein HtpX
VGNTLKTTILLAALTALIIWLGGALGGGQGALIAFVFAAVMNVGSYWFSDKIIIPMPRLYLSPTESPNAFATGRSPTHAAVAVTAGIRSLLDRRELEGVLAHELAHVINRDILISSVAATLAGAIMMLARMASWGMMFGGGQRDDREGGGGGVLGLLLSVILAPIAASLIQMAISRSREFQADDTGARVSREPEALASALRKISTYSERIPLPASPSTAHLFIVNPLHGVSLQNLFSTHPPIEQRIARLEQIASELGQRR